MTLNHLIKNKLRGLVMLLYDEKGLKWFRTFLVFGPDSNKNMPAFPSHISKLMIGYIGKAGITAEAQRRKRVAEQLHRFFNLPDVVLTYWVTGDELKTSAQMVRNWDSSNITQAYPDYKTHIQPLISSLAITHVRDSKGWTFLCNASYEGYTELVTESIVVPNINLSLTSYLSRSPLHVATMKGHVEILKILLAHQNEASLNINCRDKDGYTPLMYAARGKQVESVRLFLATAAIEVTLKNNLEETALDIAESRGFNVIADLIKEHIAKTQNNQSQALKRGS